MFDSVIANVASRFGISPEIAKKLVGLLIAQIAGSSGGLGGFLGKLRNAGLGSILGGGSPSVSGDQMKGLFGGQLGDIASRLGISESVTASAAAAALPDIVHKLALGRSAPAALPAEVTSLVRGAGGTISDAAGRVAGAAADGATSAWNWLVWAIPLVGLALLAAYLFRSCNMETPAAPTTRPPDVRVPDGAADALRATEDARGLFTAAGDTITGIKDAATAEAAIPKLQAMLPGLDTVTAAVGKLTGPAKEAIKTMSAEQVTRLKDLAAKAIGLAGAAGEKLKPVLDKVIEKVAAMAGA